MTNREWAERAFAIALDEEPEGDVDTEMEILFAKHEKQIREDIAQKMETYLKKWKPI